VDSPHGAHRRQHRKAAGAAAAVKSESEQQRRGTCCHEAGHAVVLHAYHAPLKAVWVAFNKEKDCWHGEAEPADATADNLLWQDRLVTFAAGRAAEELFECRAP
jgi:ATP-dependent Zn protease